MSGVYVQTLGAGKPLVLIHGWAMHSGIWGGFANKLAEHYKLILVDLPGHGHSLPISPFTLKTIATQLAKSTDYEPCCWLGWSMGAQVVLQMAADFPSRVNKLILLAGTPCFVAIDDWPGMKESLLNSFADMLAIDSKETLTRFLSLQVKNTDNSKSILTELKSALASAKFPDQETLQGGLEILKTADLRPVMSSLMQPTGAILGKHDTLVSAKTGVAMQQLMPSLQLHLVDRAGHTPFLSHTQHVVDLICLFMDD
ncbi:pimeloyl-[acyl-carrier protein] methyl ester esterase [biofilm metagenome]